jgi:hypothetical protein
MNHGPSVSKLDLVDPVLQLAPFRSRLRFADASAGRRKRATPPTRSLASYA